MVTKDGVIATDRIGLTRPQAVTTYKDEIKKVTDEPLSKIVRGLARCAGHLRTTAVRQSRFPVKALNRASNGSVGARRAGCCVGAPGDSLLSSLSRFTTSV
jgi:hypothetical protein